MHLLLAAADTTSAAYRQGEVMGKILVVVFALGIVTLFVVSLVKAITRKTTGWVIGCVISGLLSAFVILGFVVQAVSTLAGLSAEASARARTASATTKPVSSKDGAVTLQIPSDWKEIPGMNSEAIIQAGQPAAEQYVAILPTPKVDYAGNLQEYDELLMNDLTGKMQDPEPSEPVSGTVGPYPAIRHRIEGKIKNLAVVYYSTYVETNDCYYQIMTWTLKSRDAAAAPVLKQVTDSFTAVAAPPATEEHATAAAAKTKTMSTEDGKVKLQVPLNWVGIPSPKASFVLQAGPSEAQEQLLVTRRAKEDYNGDLNDLDALSTKILVGKLIGGETSDPASEPSGKYPALRRRLAGEVDHVNFVYFTTTLETADSYYRIVAWAGKSQEATFGPAMKTLADSFTEVAAAPESPAGE